jgi:hypothetical protein
MKTNFCLCNLFFCILLLITSCKKEEKNVTPKLAYEFALSYKGTMINSEFELILSTGNQNFLDTIMTNESEHLIKFYSSNSLVDLNIISMHEAIGNQLNTIKVRNIKTFLSVSPGEWVIYQDDVDGVITADVSVNSSATQYTSIHYKNLPFLQDKSKQMWFQSQDPHTWESSIYNISAHTFDVQGQTSGNVYLLIEPIGKYEYIKSPGLNETVDFNDAMDATKIKYSNIDNSTLFVTMLGFSDNVAPYDSFTYIYSNFQNGRNAEYDLIYPDRSFKKYETQIEWYNQSNTYSIYSFNDVPPATLQFLDDSYLNVTKNTLSEFSVEFKKNAPTFYKLILKNQSLDFDWTIYVPSTTKTIYPKTIFDSLDSKLLVNKSIDDVTIKSVIIQDAENLTYQEFWNVIFDKNVFSDRKISLYKGFQKSL